MKISLIILQSSDGFISKDLDDSLDWGSKEDKRMFKEISTEIGTIIIGRKTFESMPKRVFELNSRNWFVLSRNDNESDLPNIKFWNKSIQDLISFVEKENINKLLVAGGNSIYQQFLDLNIVDEIFMTVSPVKLENGIIGINESNLQKFMTKEKKNLNSGEKFLHYIKT